uniref:Uncharacterized protein n=1 Tax=Helianthus annuus TaxID=4232 RepID=A0A251RZP6_HELAN
MIFQKVLFWLQIGCLQERTMTSSYCPTIPDIGAMALYAIQTVNWVKAKCPYQTGGTESGYNVLKFMKEVVEEGIEILANGNDEDIDGIREGVRVMGQLCFQVTILDVEVCTINSIFFVNLRYLNYILHMTMK